MPSRCAFYQFGEFALDLNQQRLIRLESGEPIALTAKVFDTLVCLIERAGETLDKETLLRAIWPDVVVEENSLTQNISTLRQLFGETRGENRYIITIPRKGYRFVAEVSELDELAPGTQIPPPARSRISLRPSKRGQILGLGVLLAVLGAAVALFVSSAPTRAPASAQRQTLAVLPFRPIQLTERNESLELGMTDSLISSLGQYGATITPLSSVRRYAAVDQDPVIAGRQLGVDMVLDGSLQRSADRLRVSVRLLEVASGNQLWTESFDQDFTNIFEVQDAIAAKVAMALPIRLRKVGSNTAASHTRDPEAYALYSSGRFAWTRQSEASLLQAIDFYEQAIARDPSYALAYSGLADAHAVLAVLGIRAPHEAFPSARSAAEKALSIDPQLASAHSALGHIMVQYDHDWDGAAREYARALQLDPALALTYHRRGILFAMRGDIEGALTQFKRASELEPLWLAPRAITGHILYYAKRYDEGIRVLEQVLALDDRADNARAFLIRNLIGNKHYERALALNDQRPLRTPGSNAFRAQALALSGQRDAALGELDRVLNLSKTRYVAAYDVALIYVALADKGNALTWLEHSMEDRSTLVTFLDQDPAFDALHAEPRFRALVQRLGITRHKTGAGQAISNMTPSSK